jgi:hypothetical protein
MMNSISRRALLGAIPAAGLLAKPQTRSGNDIPRVDYHAHPDDTMPQEKAIAVALATSRRLGVKFGILEHAGTKANKYPNLMSTDEDLRRWIALLQGKPCFKGIQAEGLDWMTCFSKDTVVQLDYALSDALTFPEKSGVRIELWRPWVEITDHARQDFMERYTDFNVKVMAAEPIDILANPTFLPDCLTQEFDTLWTPERMKRIIDASIQYGVAIEINSRYKLPRLPFLKMAKAAGARFSFGSNIHGAGVGQIDYCLEMAKELGLKRKDFFTPAPVGKKPIEWRKFS